MKGACNKCIADETRQRYAADAEYRQRVRAADRRYKEKHPDREKESRARRNAAKKEQRAKYDRIRLDRIQAAATPEDAERLNRLREARRRADATMRARYPELFKVRKRSWYERKGRLRFEKRRAEMYGVRYETVRLDEVLKRDGAWCYLCGRNVPREYVTLDHVVPLVRGGSHTYDNVRIACRFCNSRKGKRLLSELDWYRSDSPCRPIGQE